MTKEEIRELIADMRAMGLDVELCDTPVPVSLSGVPCGFPEDIGDECIDDYYLVPKSLVGPNPEMLVHAIGDSMLEAGYEPGDQLRIRFGTAVHDGDDEGTIGFNDEGTPEGEFELGARDNNYRGNIWDNAW